MDLGYIVFHPETKRYYGSLRLAALGAEVMSHFQLRNHIRSYLLELHSETKHTTNLAIRNGLTGVFLDKIESVDFGIKLFSEIGKTFPLYCTGLGKALLAHSGDDIVTAILETPLKKITERTITAPDELEKELQKIREQGYSLDNEEITRGIICVAAPIFGFGGELVGAISIAFPAYIENERGIEREIHSIRKYSSLISEALGNKRISQARIDEAKQDEPK